MRNTILVYLRSQYSLAPEAEEEEKYAKRQRSASTTPRSTSGTLPHEYDMVMGIAPVERLWSPKNRKGLRREVIQTFKMLKKLPREKLTLVRELAQKHLGLGKSMADSAAPHCESA